MSKESVADAPPPPLLRVSAFPSGESAWRVDWFGDLSYPQRTTRSNQPSVTVWLSRVVDPRWDEAVDALLSPDLTAHRQRISRKVALGTLVILRIGDLWRNQQLVARPRYEVEQFQDVDVVGDNVTIIKAGSSLDDGSFVLPSADHPWHMAATHSYCTQVALDGGRFLILPALELARFYFGTSSALLTRVVSPEFSKESICVADSFIDDRGGIADISLAPGIPAASAHDAARLVFGRKTLARASLLSRSCIKAALAQEPVFPQCVFPFVGKTNLKVKGKWLPRAGEPRKTFVAYEILSCAHPFPYSALTYRVAPGGNSAAAAGGSPQRCDGGPLRPGGRLNRREGLQERDPGRQLAGKLVRVPLNERFPDLRFKHVQAVEAAESAPAQTPHQGSTDEDGFAIGEPSDSSRLRSVELAEDKPRKRLPPIPDFLRPVVGALRRFDGVASVLTVSDEDNWTIAVTDIPYLEPIRRHPAYLLEGRPRRFCVVDLRKGALRHLLAVCEGKPPSILITPWIDEVGEQRQAIAMAMIGLMNVWEMLSGEVAPRDSGNEPGTEERLSELMAVHFRRCGEVGEPGGPTTLLQ